MSSCCQEEPKPAESNSCCEGDSSNRFDYLLWGSLVLGLVFYVSHYFSWLAAFDLSFLSTLGESVFELTNTMWHGVLLGIVMVALLGRIPREFVMSILGTRAGFTGILRATAAGLLLDLCSHGILMVGAKLYERGASIGQVIAFLVASPWNSFSLTIILITLVGWGWTLLFIVLSMVIAIIAGVGFDFFARRGTLPTNPNQADLPPGFKFWRNAARELKSTSFNGKWFWETTINGIKDSRMVLRWIFFGILLASLVRALMSGEQFETYFGPTLMGLALTLVAATIIEVCSEGSTPIAADLLNRANAPGNGFAFLMTGVATDYTEIMVLKDTTKSWRIPLFLPLLTLPQVIAIAWVMNQWA